MKNTPSSQSHPAGFTLIELIVVIAIILILMGLLFPAFSGVKNADNKASAGNDIMNITSAVKAYYTEYGKYPLLDDQASAGNLGWDTDFGDPFGKYPNYQLINVLRCPGDWVDNQNASLQNPRRIVFLEAKNAANTLQPKGGIVTSTNPVTAPNGDSLKQGTWVDPWGNQYVIFVDANYDGTISSEFKGGTVQQTGGTLWFYSSANPGGGVVRLSAGACSLGKDGKWGNNGDKLWTGSDDVVSWQ